MKKITFAILAMAAMTMSAAAETTYYVSPSGSDFNDGLTQDKPFKTIMKAVKLLADKEPTTIVLESDATFDIGGPEAIIIGENKSVTIKGNNTTLKSGDKEYLGDRGIEIKTGTDARLEGLVITNCCTRDGIPGGAVFFEGNKLEVDHCTFYKNEGNNSAGALASRGKDVIITNCVFDSNRVFGGYGCGTVLYHCGLPNAAAEKCSLIIRNCSFTNNESKNDTNGDLIGFMHFYRGSSYTHKYSNVTYFEMANCLIKDNVAGSPSTSVRPRPADICLENVRDDFEMNLVNNTFYNTKVIAFKSFFDTPWRLINNVFYNKETFTIISEHESDERDELIAYNNIFVGDFAENLHIDDPCFTSKKEEYGNIICPASDWSQLCYDKRTSNEGGYAHYLPITDANSVIIDKGLDSTLGIAGCNTELVPATDIRGAATAGKKDIGCFEYSNNNGINATAAAAELFSLSSNGSDMIVKNLSGKELTVKILLVDGRTIYTTTVAESTTISSTDLTIANGLLIITATDGTATQTVKTVAF